MKSVLEHNELSGEKYEIDGWMAIADDVVEIAHNSFEEEVEAELWQDPFDHRFGMDE